MPQIVECEEKNCYTFGLEKRDFQKFSKIFEGKKDF
jgi:hypothetical protein